MFPKRSLTLNTSKKNLIIDISHLFAPYMLNKVIKHTKNHSESSAKDLYYFMGISFGLNFIERFI